MIIVISSILSFLEYFGTGITVFILLFLPGYVAVSLLFKRLSGEEKLSLSFAPSVFLYAGLILLAVALPFSIKLFCLLTAVLIFLVSLYIFFRKKLYSELAKTDKFALLAVILIFIFAISFVALPGDRAETAYANKTYSMKAPVLPGDPYLPYRVAQFLLNRLPVKKTIFYADWFFVDRTPLMGMVTAYFEASLYQKVPAKPLMMLPGRSYILIDSDGYWLYRIVASLLSSLFLLPAYLLARRLFGKKVALFSLFFLIINPYLIINTFFTWPKLMVAYFVLLSYYFVVQDKHYFLSGILSGLAYLSHPMAALFILGVPLFIFMQTYFSRETLLKWAKFLGGLVPICLPWFFWTMAILKQPSRMITYPLGYILKDPSNKKELLYAIKRFLATPWQQIVLRRVYNFYGTLFSFPFSVWKVSLTYKGIRNAVWGTYYYTLPGLLSLPLSPFVYFAFVQRFREFYRYLTSFVIIPFIFALLFWGVWTRGLGIDLLEPFPALLASFGICLLLQLANKGWGKYLFVSVFVLSFLEHLIFIWRFLYKPSFPFLFNSPLPYFFIVVLALWYLGVSALFFSTYCLNILESSRQAG